MANIVITGANRGIGRELALQLSARGDNIIAPVRLDSRDLSRSSIEVHGNIDITDDAAIRTFADALRGRRIDVLINNAAIFMPDEWRNTSSDTALTQFEVNALGPVRLSRALLGNFRHGSKIIMISSQSGSIGMATTDDVLGYRMSKAALNMAGKVLANGLKDDGIAVVMIHPGSVATRMNATGELSPAESARAIISMIDRTTIETTGTFWHVNGSQLPW